MPNRHQKWSRAGEHFAFDRETFARVAHNGRAVLRLRPVAGGGRGATMRRARDVCSDASRAVIVDIQGLEGGREPAPLLALNV